MFVWPVGLKMNRKIGVNLKKSNFVTESKCLTKNFGQFSICHYLKKTNSLTILHAIELNNISYKKYQILL